MFKANSNLVIVGHVLYSLCVYVYCVVVSKLYTGVMWRSWVRAPSKAPLFIWGNTLYPYCLVLVGSRNGFERDFTIELK